MTRPTLHFLCGLMGSGKSTLAACLAEETSAVLIAEDEWLSSLYPGEVTSLEAYRDHSRRLRGILWPHAATLLGRGVSVVLDFAANTRGQRAPMADLIRNTGAPHILHVLDTPPEICRTRVAARNASGLHPFAPTPEDFDRFANFFELPDPDEGFKIQRHPG